MTTIYEISARRPSDFALVEERNTNEREANITARQLYANGYDVTVTLVTRETVAEWKQGDDE